MNSDATRQLDTFLQNAGHLSQHTLLAYRRDLQELIKYCDACNIQTWQEVDARLLQKWVASRHRSGISGRSLQRALSSVRRFFAMLAELGVVAANPAVGVTTPARSRNLPKALFVEQAVQLSDIKADDALAIRDHAMIELLYSAGLRLSELVNLDLTQLDLNEAMITVVGKGNRSRLLPIGKHAIEALRAWLEIRPQFVAANTPVQAVFLSKHGKRISQRNVQYRLRDWAVRQGLSQHVHPHVLRHSFASHLLQSSGDLRGVQELLGHSNISTTQVYTQLDFQHLAKVYDKAHPRAHRKKRVVTKSISGKSS